MTPRKRFVLGEGIAEYDSYRIGLYRKDRNWFYLRMGPKIRQIKGKRVRLIAEVMG